MADLKTLAENLLASGPVKVEKTPHRVRGLLDGVWLFDTISAVHVWENKYYPQFWIPVSAVASGLLKKHNAVDANQSAFTATVKGQTKSTDRVLLFEKGPLQGLVRFEFKTLDAWFEEDVEIYGHPKNPYTRIDVLPSSRKIEVKIAGVSVAKSSNPVLLLETGLRTRYYLPKTSVNWEYLTKSDTTTTCPYKGLAKYYNVKVEAKEYKDVVWWYEHPTTESTGIQGLVSFYNEKVDILVDGVLEEK